MVYTYLIALFLSKLFIYQNITNKLIVYDKDGIQIDLNNQNFEKFVYIIKTQKNCLNCFDSLPKFISSNYPDYKIGYIAYSKGDIVSLLIENKKVNIKYKTNIPFYYFIDEDSTVYLHNNENIFTLPSPSLLLINNKSITYKSFDSIFED
jgi:hypothetical protein